MKNGSYTDHLNIVITGLQFIDRSDRVYNLAQMGAKSYPCTGWVRLFELLQNQN
jgi:hypothetical protein